MTDQWHGGKGSRTRPTDKKKFDENWDKIFGNKKDKEEKKDEKVLDIDVVL